MILQNGDYCNSRADEVTTWLNGFFTTGDKQFLGKIYTRYRQLIFSHCLKILNHREDAKDITADAFLRAFEKIHSFDCRKPFQPWLVRIATNLCIDHLRRKKAVQFLSLHEGTMEMPGGKTARINDCRDEIEKILHAMSKLSHHQRQCFSLFYIHQKSYREIAASTGYSCREVRSYIQNGRRKVRLEIDRQLRGFAKKIRTGELYIPFYTPVSKRQYADVVKG